MTCKSTVIILILFALVVQGAVAQIAFEGLDLNEVGVLLFSTKVESPVFGGYTTLFSSWVKERSISQLTYFPEELDILDGGGQLQIRNRFGVFRTYDDLSGVRAIKMIPGFATGGEIETGKPQSMVASPNGRYIAYMKQKLPGLSDIYLLDIDSEKSVLVAEGVAQKFGGDGLLWFHDSAHFLYTKDDGLYYFSMRQYMTDRIIPERYRYLGRGNIRSVFVSNQGDLYYLRANFIYKIPSNELFTATLYQNLVERGTLAGKIPFEFDESFDRFWISPDGKKILLDNGGRNFFVYHLVKTDFLSTGEVVSLPYMHLPRNTRVKEVLWSKSDLLTINTEAVKDGGIENKLFQIDLSREESGRFTTPWNGSYSSVIISPDGTKVAALSEDRVTLLDYESWRELEFHSHPAPIKVVWSTSSTMIIAGRHYAESWNLQTDQKELLFLTQVEEYGFEQDRSAIVASTAGRWFRYESGRWLEVESGTTVNRSRLGTTSYDYRVYLDSSEDRSYTNQVMVRVLDKLDTVPLFRLPEKKFEPFPEIDDPVDFKHFRHGSRLRLREVAVVFNVMNSSDGLTEVLSTLKEYRIKATFFLNGEFIRHSPDAAREIAQSGHEVGSLFYSGVNMTDSRYEIDDEFVSRGLARNEDDYYAATGKELSLFWHAPYYTVTSDMVEIAHQSSYRYVGRDVDPLDWIDKASAPASSAVSLSVPEMINRVIMDKKAGSIIPIHLGASRARSGGHLYNSLDTLLNALIQEGYTVVPVSTLIEHAK